MDSNLFLEGFSATLGVVCALIVPLVLLGLLGTAIKRNKENGGPR